MTNDCYNILRLHGNEVLAAIVLKLGPRIAGDIERLIAKHYGYGVGNPYDEKR